MITIKVDENTVLVADYQGLLTRAEEEVLAWKFLGKGNGATATILNKSPETVRTQLRIGYDKTGVSGSDNPLAILQLISFQRNWVKLVSTAIILFSIYVPGRSNLSARVVHSFSRSLRTESCS